MANNKIMASWNEKVLNTNETFNNNIVVTHDLQDCIDESLDFSFDNVYNNHETTNSNNKTNKLQTYIGNIQSNNENAG